MKVLQPHRVDVLIEEINKPRGRMPVALKGNHED